MNTYVLGAGASHHAGYPLADALGNELYDWVHKNWPEGASWRGYIEELHRLYGGLADLEGTLTELDDCPSGSRAATLTKDHRANMGGAVRFCISEFFDSIRQRPTPLYDAWARGCVQRDDVIITFNYDLACERALRTAGHWEISNGYGFPLRTGATHRSEVKVLKLHGSTNWLWPLFGDVGGPSQVSGNVLPPSPVIRCGRDFEFLGYPNEPSDPSRQQRPGGALPAVIMGHKRFCFETPRGPDCAQFWQELWEQAKLALQVSQEIVIIGYGMPAADQDARMLLLQSPEKNARITHWCGKASAGLRDEFASHGFTQISTNGENYFEDFIRSWPTPV
jgi:hypothetical protein